MKNTGNQFEFSYLREKRKEREGILFKNKNSFHFVFSLFVPYFKNM